ncbi:hypothetical protein F2Q68_00028779 [Brassica cretica]|nr:hypothetical protein F2Q68_00028779 [Brassica cretica]KAF3528844.1 hypothetical protein DY000_02036455 [Brassica cretica]
MVPWMPHYTYPLPVVAITQGPVSTLPFPLNGTQTPAPLPNPCTTFMPYSTASLSPKTEQNDDFGLELELKIHASSLGQQDVSGKEKKGNSTITASSSNSCYLSSQAVQDGSP